MKTAQNAVLEHQREQGSQVGQGGKSSCGIWLSVNQDLWENSTISYLHGVGESLLPQNLHLRE